MLGLILRFIFSVHFITIRFALINYFTRALISLVSSGTKPWKPVRSSFVYPFNTFFYGSTSFATEKKNIA